MTRNRNYAAGRRFEYEVKKELQKRGYLALRTAGSHGFADVIGLCQRPRDEHVVFIQCKVVAHVSEVNPLQNAWRKEVEDIRLPISCFLECWCKVKGQGAPIAWRKH